MITFERTGDLDTVRDIMTHPRIYPHISDDFSAPREQFRPIDHPAIWYVLVRDVENHQGRLLGVFIFVPLNGVCWEVHTALLPSSWGEAAHAAARLLPEWIWKNTDCRRIITNVPQSNRLALTFAIASGMKIFGVNHSSYLRDGKLHNQILLGISPDDQTSHVTGSIDTGEEEPCLLLR